MPTEPDWPHDEVLIELGRIAYAAMDLEGIVQSVSQSVIGAGDEVRRAPAGLQAVAAIEVLNSWPPTVTRDNGRRWLTKAQDALTGRHSILHATIVNLIVPVPGGKWEISPATWLQHIPKTGSAGLPVELTATELQAIRKILVDARHEWANIAVDLYGLRAIRWNHGQIDRSSLTRRNRYG